MLDCADRGREQPLPSSMIFVSLVVVWLLILVPAVARREQEVARPSAAALSGRVLSRPNRRRWSQEVAQMDLSDDRAATTYEEPDRDERREHQESRVPAARVPHDDLDDRGLDDGGLDDRGLDDRGLDDRGWERPPARYRPGRGGYDPEAAALAARARYATRQRIVLGLLVTVLAGALAALFVSSALWWLVAAAGAVLVGYLAYLRRQVRLEEAIRARRAARMAGTRRPSAADDPELDGWARRGRAAAGGTDDRDVTDGAEHDYADDESAGDESADLDADDGDPTRVRGVGEPVGVLPARPRTARPASDEGHEPADDDEPDEVEAALPRLAPTPPPPLPAGTSLVDVDEEELELGELDRAARPGYRRAVGE